MTEELLERAYMFLESANYKHLPVNEPFLSFPKPMPHLPAVKMNAVSQVHARSTGKKRAQAVKTITQIIKTGHKRSLTHHRNRKIKAAMSFHVKGKNPKEVTKQTLKRLYKNAVK